VKQFAQLFFLIILMIFSIAENRLLAEEKINPTDYLKGVADNIIQVLDKNQSSLKGNQILAEKIIRENLLPYIDQDKFSKKVLKSKLWKSLTANQQTQFKQAFVDQVIDKYAKGLELYDGQKFTFEEAKISSKGNALVSSKMKLASAESLTIGYYLSPEENGWKIYNIVVDGIDMAKSYRNQFLPRISEVGVEKFIQELNTPTESS